jgi:DNA-binding GntR family transcriptional regulator
MVRTDAAQTLSDEVYRSLRAAILAGEYSPGERLLPSDLSARHESKPGVIREALGRLAAEGLLTLEPNRGFRVIEVSRRSIEELLELRRINAGAASRLSVEQTDADHAAAALAAMDRLTSAPQGPERGLAHREFHGALISACPNQRLLGLCAALFESSELHRHWSAAALLRPAHKGGRHQDVEHRAILRAVMSRDADLAVELHLQHLERTVELALAYVAFRDGEAEPVAASGGRSRRSTA